MFDRYDPLREGDLRSNIEALAAKINFPLAKIYVVEGTLLKMRTFKSIRKCAFPAQVRLDRLIQMRISTAFSKRNESFSMTLSLKVIVYIKTKIM